MSLIKFGQPSFSFTMPKLFSIGADPAPAAAPTAPAAPAGPVKNPRFLAKLDEMVTRYNIVNAGIARRYLAVADAQLDQARVATEEVTRLAGAREASRESVKAAYEYNEKLKKQLAPMPDDAPLDQQTRRHVAFALQRDMQILKTVDEIKGTSYLADLGEGFKTVLKWAASAGKQVVHTASEAVKDVADTAVKPMANALSGLVWPLAIVAVGGAAILIATKSGGSKAAAT